MGEVIHIHEYLERKIKSTPLDVRKRLAEIAIEKMLLQSEEEHLLHLLDE